LPFLVFVISIKHEYAYTLVGNKEIFFGSGNKSIKGKN